MDDYEPKRKLLWPIIDPDQRAKETCRLEGERTLEDPIRYLYFVNHGKFPSTETTQRLSSALRTIAADLRSCEELGPEAKLRVDAALRTLKHDF